MSRENDLSKLIIGAAIEVHRALGPGLLESAYEECLCFELKQVGLSFERQLPLPVRYKSVPLDCGYRLDVVVEKLVIIELKAVEHLTNLHDAQLLTYLKLSELCLGILLNFNAATMKDGLKRVANQL